VDLQQIGLSELNRVPFSQGKVAFGGGPTEVPDVLVQTIRKKVGAINVAGGEQLEGIKRGDPILISAGPFSGHSAIFDLALPGSERVRVLLQLLSKQQVPLEIPSGHIQKKTRR
jgi:transcription antitermination factor NusG